MEKDVIFLIKKLESFQGKKLDEYDKKRSVSTISCGIIDFCYDREKDGVETTQSDIEKEFYLSKSTCSDVLNKLESELYLKREIDQIDRRKKNIVLLDKAREIQDYNRKKFEETEYDLLSPLNDEEKKVFKSCLIKILGGNLNEEK